ncbi:hypothetical protein Hanom_Chr09g00796661 [Helianthus anomalus]
MPCRPLHITLKHYFGKYFSSNTILINNFPTNTILGKNSQFLTGDINLYRKSINHKNRYAGNLHFLLIDKHAPA